MAPDINDFTDLRRRVFAVDAPTTGYAIIDIFILKTRGLELSRDYRLKSFGNTAARCEALSRGYASGAMMGRLDNEIEKRGFRVLARAEEYVKRYARRLGTIRRQWADVNQDLLVRFIRAMIRASDWLLDRANEAEAIELLATTMHRKKAQAIYAEARSADFGIVPRCRIEVEGTRGAMELRKAAGLMDLVSGHKNIWTRAIT